MPFLRLKTIFVSSDKETLILSILTHNKILFSKLIIWIVSGFKTVYNTVYYSGSDGLWLSGDYLR